MKVSLTLTIAFSILILLVRCSPDNGYDPTEHTVSTDTYDSLGITWMVVERDDIIFYFEDMDYLDALIFANRHQDAYNILKEVFEPQLPQKARYFVWTDRDLAEELLGKPLGFALPQKCVCYIHDNQTLGHEMTHMLSYWAGGVEPTEYARFINEGVAVAFDLSERDFIAMAKEALAGQNVNSIRDFWDGNLQNAPEEILYPTGGAFMQLLYQQNMPDKYYSLLKNQSFGSAQNIYGKDWLDTFIADFDKQVGL